MRSDQPPAKPGFPPPGGRLSGEALAELTGPLLEDLETRLRRTVDASLRGTRSAAADLLDRSGREARRTVAEAEEAGRRSAAVAARYGRAVLADLQLRAHDQGEALGERVDAAIRRWGETHEELADSMMAKVLVLALNLALGYAGYLWAAAGADQVHWAAVARIGWLASSVVSLGLYVSWQVGGRDRRVRQLLVWELYVAALAAIATAGLLLADLAGG